MKILRVNLTKEKISDDEVDSSDFLGGRGLGVDILAKEVDPKVDPLSKDNKLVLSIGPVTGTSVPFSGRCSATSKSPLTGTILSSNVGGMLGYELSRTGYMAIVIEGTAGVPLYLTIEKEAELASAEKMWGKTVFETADILGKQGIRERHIACIGPAGENRVRFANIMVQKHRAFGRGGLGAVMGAKNLKAIVVKGSKKKEDNYSKISAGLRKKIIGTKSSLKTHGTSNILGFLNTIEALPTKNFQRQSFEGADKINGDALKKYTIRSDTCYSCIVACKRITKSKKYNIITDGPEYETLAAFGSYICNDDIESIIKANDLCDDLGLDTISMGSTIAHYMELYDKWEDNNLALELAKKTAYREGIGNELAEGAVRFAASKGMGAIVVKGLEMAGYHPNALHGQGLSFSTSNRGADHLYSMYYLEEMRQKDRKTLSKEKIKRLIYCEDRNAVLDSLILCKFSVRFYDMKDYAAIASLALGKKITEEELLEFGARIVTAERAFNVKAGLSRKDDILPERFNVPGIEKALQEYYSLREWSKEGIPF